MDYGDWRCWICEWMLEEDEDKITKDVLYRIINFLFNVIFPDSKKSFSPKNIISVKVCQNIRHLNMIKFRLLFATSKTCLVKWEEYLCDNEYCTFANNKEKLITYFRRKFLILKKNLLLHTVLFIVTIWSHASYLNFKYYTWKSNFYYNYDYF